MGTIKAVEGDTLVVTTEKGEIRVQTTDTTLIEKSMALEVGDLEVGEQVMVSGSQNDDGSITARSIRISAAR
jgi:hydrogenase maturation factor